jgi:F-type H+-transporting ATPase subunit b
MDGFTLAAQLFNFVLLVFLLKRFLYRPVLDALARREATLCDQQAETQRQREAADAAAQAMAAERASFEAAREARLREIDAELEAYRSVRSREAQDAVRQLRIEWTNALRRQQEEFLEDLGEVVVEETRRIVRRILYDLSDVHLEGQVVRGFLKQIMSVPQDLRGGLLAYVKEGETPVLILESGFPLSEAQQRDVTASIGGWIGRAAPIEFIESPALGLSIEFRIGEKKLSWGVNAYLEPLLREGKERLARGLA